MLENLFQRLFMGQALKNDIRALSKTLKDLPPFLLQVTVILTQKSIKIRFFSNTESFFRFLRRPIRFPSIFLELNKQFFKRS